MQTLKPRCKTKSHLISRKVLLAIQTALLCTRNKSLYICTVCLCVHAITAVLKRLTHTFQPRRPRIRAQFRAPRAFFRRAMYPPTLSPLFLFGMRAFKNLRVLISSALRTMYNINTIHRKARLSQLHRERFHTKCAPRFLRTRCKKKHK